MKIERLFNMLKSSVVVRFFREVFYRGANIRPNYISFDGFRANVS